MIKAPLMQQTIERTTLVDQLLVKLRKAISTGQFDTGSRLPSEAEIGRLFGVGRSTVREAIKVLRNLGDVETINGVGTYVTRPAPSPSRKPDRADVLRNQQVLDFRYAIELRAAEVAAQVGTTASMKRVKAAWQRSRKPDGDGPGQQPQQAKAVYQFHLAVIAASRNGYLETAYASLQDEIEASISLLLSMGPPEKVEDLHADLVAALEGRQPAAAAKAVRQTFHQAHSRLQLLLADT